MYEEDTNYQVNVYVRLATLCNLTSGSIVSFIRCIHPDLSHTHGRHFTTLSLE